MTSIHRPLPDGASYELCAPMPGCTSVTVHDSDGDRACTTLQRGEVRQLIEYLTLIAGLQPTAAELGAATAIAGAVRRNFELLAELAKTDAPAADAIAASIAAHLRSWRPRLLASEVLP